MKVVLLGVGEVGQAIKDICVENGHETFVIEKDFKDEYSEFDVLLVNIPFSPKFIEYIESAIGQYKPKMIIINSTVPMGTTRKVEETIGIPTIHSPVRGVHPNLKEGIKTFIKYVGATNPDNAELAIDFLESLKIRPRAFDSPEETELAKLLCTTTYGEYIAWATEVKRICDKYKLNFDNVYTDFNVTYNIGYLQLDMSQVIRPVLKPCKDGFGGHCVYENTQLLNGVLDKDWKKHIDKIGKKK